jgi:glycosyltransferase involved in cell wall biosynthesis
MATYNGQRFVREQLDTIVPQLSGEDEIILIDDQSTDGTLALLKELQQELAGKIGSPRIFLAAHAKNLGVVHTFEETLRDATGDILFLADDDDRWAPDKVERVLKAFAADPDLQIVSTGLELIDEEGRPISTSGFLRHRRFSAGVLANMMHNQFQGSAMALRSTVLQYVLPFPKDKLFLHDVWIGLRTLLHGGKVLHLEAPLLFYRRHGANVSRRYSMANQIKLRLQLVASLVGSAFHKL